MSQPYTHGIQLVYYKREKHTSPQQTNKLVLLELRIIIYKTKQKQQENYPSILSHRNNNGGAAEIATK